jgi:hypothetical protein
MQEFGIIDILDKHTLDGIAQLNKRATAWIWGRPPKDHRHNGRVFYYRI